MNQISMGRTKGSVRPIEPGTTVIHYDHERPMRYDGPVEGPRSAGFDIETRDMGMLQRTWGIRCDLWKIAPESGLVVPQKDARVKVSKPGTIGSTRGDWLLEFDGERIRMFKRKGDAAYTGLKLAAITDWHRSAPSAEPHRTAEQAPAVTVSHTRLSMPTQIRMACDELGLPLTVTTDDGGGPLYGIGGRASVPVLDAADYLIQGGFTAGFGASVLRIRPERLAEAAARAQPPEMDEDEDEGLAAAFAELVSIGA